MRCSSIGELCDAGGASLQTGPFGSQLHASDYVEDGVPVVPTEALVDGRIDHELLPMITRGKARELSRHELSAGDIVFARRGVQATGRTSRIGRAEDGFIGGTGIIRLRIHAERAPVTPDFMAWVLRSPDSVAWLKHHAIGATMPNLNEGIIRTVPVPLLPIREQHRIAGILSAFDEKIELNSRMADNLEAVARATFRSTFVSGQGGSADLADPPDSPVPVGWRRARLGDIAPTLLGGTPSRAEPRFWGGDIPWLNSGEANEFRVIEASDYITEAGLSQSATKLVPPRTTLVAITGATLGQITITEIAACINQSLVAILGTDDLPTEYLYFWLQERIGDLVASQTGAAQQHVNKNDVNALWIMIPPRPEIRDYLGTVRPMFDRIASAVSESLTLAATRDALLPRLLSGQLTP